MMNLTSKFIAVGAGCLGLTTVFSPLAKATDLPQRSGGFHHRVRSDPDGPHQPQRGPANLGPGDQRRGDLSRRQPGHHRDDAQLHDLHVYSAQIGNGQYVEINFEEPNAGNDLFVSAWTTYSGTSSVNTPAGAPLGTNGFLGDEGSSGDYAFGSIPPTPQDPHFFNVTVPAGQDLVVVVNTTAAAALGETYGIDIEDFSTKDYANAVAGAVPEPSSWVMLARVA